MREIDRLPLLPLAYPTSEAASPITPSGLNTQVTLSATPPAGKSQYNITGGTRPGGGANLFHSLGDFNVPTNNIANFLNSGSVDLNGALLQSELPTSNVLGRITGGNPSSIFGMIQTNGTGGFGNANLFLINPYGFLFGPNATVNVGGMVSFTTADYMRFTDNARFNTVAGASDSLLSTAPIAAFGFLGSNPAAIAIQGSTLQVADGQSLSFIGGSRGFTATDPDTGNPISVPGGVTVAGGILSAPGGQINLASVASPGELSTVDFMPTPGMAMGNISLSQGARLDVSADPAGTVKIRGGQLVMDQAAVTAGTLGASDGAPVAVDIHAVESLVVDHESQIGAASLGTGRAGDVQITGGNFEVRNSSVVGFLSIPSATTDVSNVVIGTDSVHIIGGGGGPTGIFSRNLGSGQAGNITINTGNLVVNGNEGNVLISASAARGNAGRIDVNAQNVLLEATGPFRALLGVQTTVEGNSGSLHVTTDQLEIRGDSGGFAGLNAGNNRLGNAGTVEITAQDVFMRAGSGSVAQITAGHIGQSGDAGQVLVDAGNIEIRGLADISTTRVAVPGTQASGISGTIKLTADRILIDGEGLQEERAIGGLNSLNLNTVDTRPAGGIDITSRELTLSNVARISTFTNSSARAGDILVRTESLDVTHGAIFDSSTFGSGDAGTINIAADRITLSGPSPLTITGVPTPTGGSQVLEVAITGLFGVSGLLGGKAGAIEVNAGELIIRDGAQIGTQTFGSSPGGDITVNAGIVLIAGADTEHGVPSAILADASAVPEFSEHATGKGGNIVLQSDQLVLSNGGAISANTGGAGNGDSVSLEVARATLQGDATEISTSSGLVDKTTGTRLVGNGAAGAITFTATDTVALSDGASINVTTLGAGTGGDITVSAGQTVSLANHASITAQREPSRRDSWGAPSGHEGDRQHEQRSPVLSPVWSRNGLRIEQSQVFFKHGLFRP